MRTKYSIIWIIYSVQQRIGIFKKNVFWQRQLFLMSCDKSQKSVLSQFSPISNGSRPYPLIPPHHDELAEKSAMSPSHLLLNFYVQQPTTGYRQCKTRILFYKVWAHDVRNGPTSSAAGVYYDGQKRLSYGVTPARLIYTGGQGYNPSRTLSLR